MPARKTGISEAANQKNGFIKLFFWCAASEKPTYESALAYKPLMLMSKWKLLLFYAPYS